MRHLYMRDRRHIIGLTIHWAMLKNILWIMDKAFKYIKIGCIIIFLLGFGHFLEDDILDGQIRWNMHPEWTKMEQNKKSKINRSGHAFYASEPSTNIG